jgi:hypothetical protein
MVSFIYADMNRVIHLQKLPPLVSPAIKRTQEPAPDEISA